MKEKVNHILNGVGTVLLIFALLIIAIIFFWSYGKLWAKVANHEIEIEQLKKDYGIVMPNKYNRKHLKAVDMQLKGKVKDCTLYPTRNGAKCVDERTGKVYTIYF